MHADFGEWEVGGLLNLCDDQDDLVDELKIKHLAAYYWVVSRKLNE
jgi:hypothetical protein